jgi:hypothetical protein
VRAQMQRKHQCGLSFTIVLSVGVPVLPPVDGTPFWNDTYSESPMFVTSSGLLQPWLAPVRIVCAARQLAA